MILLVSLGSVWVEDERLAADVLIASGLDVDVVAEDAEVAVHLIALNRIDTVRFNVHLLLWLT